MRTESRLIRFGDNPILHAPGSAWTAPRFVEYLEEFGPACGYDFEIIRIDHDERNATNTGPKFEPNYTVGGFGDGWSDCPFDTEDEAERFLVALRTCAPKFVSIPTAWGKGKTPELEAARESAVWPDATLEQLQDKGALMARLPELMREFRAAVESLGLTY